ncbi:MAG: RNA pseudouridine synthase, partial [Gemmiger sp.]|nr:RNA pseudouridine synthase [Gemmiger sp.]
METFEHFERVVPPEDAGQRLDKWLADACTALSRNALQGLIEGGQARCN